MIVAAYCRVSTSREDQENSYENQLSYFCREITAAGHTLYKLYGDKGISGTKLDRPELNKMLYDAGIDLVEVTAKNKTKPKTFVPMLSDRKPLFNEIWLKNTSRFARNTMSYELIQKLRDKKVYLYFKEQDINTKDETKDLLLKMMQIFDEQDSKDKSSKVTTGRIESAKKGRVYTNGKLFGYKYIQHENRLEIIPEEAEIVRLIFELYTEQNKGARQIVGELNRRGIITRKGKPFVKTTITRILQNEKYAGLNNPFKYDIGKVFHKNTYAKVNKEYEKIPSDKIPAIITVEQLNKAKALRDAKEDTYGQRGVYKGISKYCGKIICGKCGANYISNVDRGRIFYNCSNKKLYGTQVKNRGAMHGNEVILYRKDYRGPCNALNINESTIDSILEKELEDNATNYVRHTENATHKALNTLYAEIQTQLSLYDPERNIKAAQVKSDLQAEEEKQGKVLNLFLERPALKGNLQGQLEIIDTKINELKEEYASLTQDDVQTARRINKLYSLFVKMENATVKPPKDIEELLESIEHIVIYSHGIERREQIVYKEEGQLVSTLQELDIPVKALPIDNNVPLWDAQHKNILKFIKPTQENIEAMRKKIDEINKRYGIA